jgi:separase
MPIRKARILVRCLEFAYRDSANDGITSFGYGTVEEVAAEIDRLCTLQVSQLVPSLFVQTRPNVGTLQSFAKDSSLAHFSLQYRAAAQLWVALHSHRRVHPEQNAIMTQRSEEACRLMKMILAPESVGSAKISRFPTSPRLVKKSAGLVAVGRVVSPKTSRTMRLKVPAAPRKPVPIRKTTPKVVNDSNVVKPKTKMSRTFGYCPVASWFY